MSKCNCGNLSAPYGHGSEPLVFNIDRATKENETFRTTVWTGQHLQLTLMCIPPHGDIGVERHQTVDQFIRVVSGRGVVYRGCQCNALQEAGCVGGEDAVLIPAGTWHNIVNTGNCPLKVYSLYAPPQHAPGTVHCTKADAMAEEGH